MFVIVLCTYVGCVLVYVYAKVGSRFCYKLPAGDIYHSL